MRTKRDVEKETIELILRDSKLEAIFISKITQEFDASWFIPLKEAGLFNQERLPGPIPVKGGYTLPFWPQAGYLEAIATKAGRNEIDRSIIPDLIAIFRSYNELPQNELLLRILINCITLLPLSYLTSRDIERIFTWTINLGVSSKNTLASSALIKGLGTLVTGASNCPHDLEIIYTYVHQLLEPELAEKKGVARDPVLRYLARHEYHVYVPRDVLKKLEKDKAFIWEPILAATAKRLKELLEKIDLDKHSNFWRPAVEPSRQNEFHDSAGSLTIDLARVAASAILEAGSVPNVIHNDWAKSDFLTEKRLIISLATDYPSKVEANWLVPLIQQWGLSSVIRHELYRFLEKRFDSLDTALQKNLLSLIDALKVEDFENDNRDLVLAYEKIRWYSAIRNSKREDVQKEYNRLLSAIGGTPPAHPDFSAYMGETFVGPISPISSAQMEAMNAEDLVTYLKNYTPKETFAGPSIEGLSRELEAYILQSPVPSGAKLVPALSKLRGEYVSAILDAYSKQWSEKKYVPINELIGELTKIVPEWEASQLPRQDWAITSIARFIETGNRADEHAFAWDSTEPLFQLLVSLLKLTQPDPRFDSSSDSYTRAINEPRGRVLGALIIVALRMARYLDKEANGKHSTAWKLLSSVLDPILQKKESGEISLYALLGFYYRQLTYLSDHWTISNWNLFFPDPERSLEIWKASMEGFCYVGAYTKDFYFILRDAGYLMRFLRLPGDENDRAERLQQRVIDLALVAFIVGDEALDNPNGILYQILEKQDEEELKYLVWSIPGVLAGSTESAHIVRAKALIERLLSKTEPFGITGLTRLLDLFDSPESPLVERLILQIAKNAEDSWTPGDVIEFFYKFRETHTALILKLFLSFLGASKAAPQWPDDKIQAICSAFLEKGFKSQMKDICRIYEERTFTFEPIQTICQALF